MKIKELFHFSMNFLQFENGETSRFSYLVIPQKDFFDKSKNKVFTKGIEAQVSIDEFKHGNGYQIYRDVGRWVKGNSHKSYKLLDSLVSDFELVQAEYLKIKKNND